MSKVHIWLEATRPKTLPAAVTPVLLGSGLAYAHDSFNLTAAFICLCFALLVQIGTNFANDYLDGVRGTDTDARIGPVRAVATGLISADAMRRATFMVLLAAFLVGLTLIPYGGWWLLAVGIASVACAWLYTGGPLPLAYNGLGDVFVVLFFGFIAVGCTYYVQTGVVVSDVLLLGLGCGLLVNNILIVNNYRDLEEDRQAKKRTLIVLFGRRFGLVAYLLSSIFAGGVVVFYWWSGYGILLLIALLPVFFSIRLGARLPTLNSSADYFGALKGSGLVVACYGILFSSGLFLGI